MHVLTFVFISILDFKERVKKMGELCLQPNQASEHVTYQLIRGSRTHHMNNTITDAVSLNTLITFQNISDFWIGM